jgi:hypothetical protein
MWVEVQKSLFQKGVLEKRADAMSLEGKGTLIKIVAFKKKSNVGDDTLFTLCLLLKKFFV